MAYSNAILRLYFGRCPKDDFGYSGADFNINRRMPVSDPTYQQALAILQKYLRPEFRKHIIIGSGELAATEDEAAVLIQYAEKNIEGSSGLIELHDSNWKWIRFFRQIVVTGVCELDRETLLDKLKASGHIPSTAVADGLEQDLSPEAIAGIRQHWRDYFWEQALKFG